MTASCENMIDGKGMRSGDILQAANGKTVEARTTCATRTSEHECRSACMPTLPPPSQTLQQESTWGKRLRQPP